MNPTEIFSNITSFLADNDMLARIIILLLLSVYCLYAFVLVNQIRALNRMFHHATYAPVLQITSYIHVVITIVLIIITIIIL